MTTFRELASFDLSEGKSFYFNLEVTQTKSPSVIDRACFPTRLHFRCVPSLTFSSELVSQAQPITGINSNYQQDESIQFSCLCVLQSMEVSRKFFRKLYSTRAIEYQDFLL